MHYVNDGPQECIKTRVCVEIKRMSTVLPSIRVERFSPPQSRQTSLVDSVLGPSFAVSCAFSASLTLFGLF